MKLVYADGTEVKVGDEVDVDGERMVVDSMPKPHKPSSSGRVGLHFYGDQQATVLWYAGVIGAKWVEREDQPWTI